MKKEQRGRGWVILRGHVGKREEWLGDTQRSWMKEEGGAGWYSEVMWETLGGTWMPCRNDCMI